MLELRAEATRGGLPESVHRISVAVVDPAGQLIARSGDPGLRTFWRSAAKPFQALPVVADSNFLDKQYTAFGKVVRGLEVADKIVSAPRDGRDNPNERVEMKVRVAGAA